MNATGHSDWNQAKEMEKRDLKTIQETRKKRLVKKPAKYSPSLFLLENRKRAHSSSSEDNSRVVDPISPVVSKQKRSSDNLEHIPQQRKKPRDTVVLESSPSSNGGEESIGRQHRFTEYHPTQRLDDSFGENDQSTINRFLGEDYLHSKVSECQEVQSGNAVVAKTRNKRDVPVSGLDKSKGFDSTNKNGLKENVNQYSRPNKGSGSKNSSTYDPSLASFGRKQSILQETSNNIRQVEAQEKKELSKQQNNFGKQLIPKGKSSTSSTSNRGRLQLLDVAEALKQNPQSKGSFKKRIDAGGPTNKSLTVDSRAIITQQPRQNVVMNKCNCSVVKKLILKKLTELADNQKTLAADVRLLLDHIKTEAKTPTTTAHDIVQLPVTCIAEWSLLMEVLKSDSNHAILVNDFSKLGGSDLADIVKRIMREVVTDEFGASYVGWMGQHGKYPVYGTKLMDVIFASVDRSPLLPSATKKQVEGATMNYIHRFNQRFNRAKTPIADDKDGSYKRDSESSEDDDPRKQNGNHSESSEDEDPRKQNRNHSENESSPENDRSHDSDNIIESSVPSDA
ncbi:hypothetical protein OUZ56_025461 [Daphnia magna]|uniref:DUF4806 domain-containing protein n=1 Tax=Daphnia magna TaxID=35525 RepID=A0ABQ9ZJY7_9CRUS|nr:hypothetical protein OUZ56_025461 [Daphnia magna]